ncbi:MAG: YraN family protein [Candidatus Latescibacterota bacterium]|nr:MAG: YraN family protein [Candidatus Latescibacterota bacterium]
MSTRRIGELGEQIAEAFLEVKGYRILRRNYVCAGREIDLLARIDSFLVAVEVKLRRGARYGRAIEAVDRRKLSRIQLVLSGALGQSSEPLQPRVDVVVIDIDSEMSRMIVRHIEAVY